MKKIKEEKMIHKLINEKASSKHQRIKTIQGSPARITKNNEKLPQKKHRKVQSNIPGHSQ